MPRVTKKKKTTFLNAIRTSSGSRVKRERSIEGCIGTDKKLNDGSPYAAERARERSYNLKTRHNSSNDNNSEHYQAVRTDRTERLFLGKMGKCAEHRDFYAVCVLSMNRRVQFAWSTAARPVRYFPFFFL